MLARLEAVVRVDVWCAGPWPDHLPKFAPLFPLAADVRIGGRLRFPLASAMLHGKRVPIRRLILNNAYEDGPLYFRIMPTEHEPRPGDFTLGLCDRLMRGLIHQLTNEGTCDRLKEFRLRIGAGYTAGGLVEDSPWEELREELAGFLHAVRPRIIAIEHETGLKLGAIAGPKP